MSFGNFHNRPLKIPPNSFQPSFEVLEFQTLKIPCQFGQFLAQGKAKLLKVKQEIACIHHKIRQIQACKSELN